MAFSGGAFSLLTGSSAYQTGQTADGAALYTELAGIATGLSTCIAKDGQTTIAADIPFNDKRITGLANAAASTDAMNRQSGDARYALLAGATMTGPLHLAGLTETPDGSIGTIAGNTEIDFADGQYQHGTGTAVPCTFSFANLPGAGALGAITVELTNGGPLTETWPAAVHWPGGTPPTLTASGVDILTFWTRDGGTTIYGAALLDMS